MDGIDRGGVRETRHQMAVLGRRLVIFPEKEIPDAGRGRQPGRHEARTQGAAAFTERTIEIAGTDGFRAGDGVTITGCTRNPENNKTAVVRAVEDGALVFSEGCFLPGGENIVQVTRTVPDLDFVCEKDNRLWGVHGNAICCSALGDPLNWMRMRGLATDGFETEVGTDGAFTGIAAASSHVLCFKEDCVHKVYGAKPSNFQVQVSQIPGVAAGCERSIVNLGETVYWWARDGLMAYGGGIPDRPERPAGRGALYGGVRGRRRPPPVAVRPARGSARDLGLRHRTGSLSACGYPAGRAVCRAGRHAVPGRGGRPVEGGGEPEGQQVPGRVRAVPPERARRAHGLTLLADCAGDCALTCELRTPGSAWQAVWAGEGLPEGRARIPVRPARGMQFWLRLTGRGDITLQAIRRTIYPDGPAD